jgi:hypothetical protein
LSDFIMPLPPRSTWCTDSWLVPHGPPATGRAGVVVGLVGALVGGWVVGSTLGVLVGSELAGSELDGGLVGIGAELLHPASSTAAPIAAAASMPRPIIIIVVPDRLDPNAEQPSGPGFRTAAGARRARS